ncbi:matrix-remodeling-associated protein 7 isoform 1-T1 [Synchiropus picturatus]
MDLTFLLSAAIFTLLAIVVATSIFNGSSPAADLFNRSYFVQNEDAPVAEREEAAAPRLNGHAPDLVKEQDTADNWSEISGSSHDHWDVVKTVLSEQEALPQTTGEDPVPPVDRSSSTSSVSIPRPESSLDVDSSSDTSSGRGRRSYIGLSDEELLKCAFSSMQNEAATESPDIIAENEEEDDEQHLKYLPGKSRTHHLEMMLSKEELEEEQRVQREQLAAIFQLLKENTDTFGDVSDGDMEEQLRLYSI